MIAIQLFYSQHLCIAGVKTNLGKMEVGSEEGKKQRGEWEGGDKEAEWKKKTLKIMMIKIFRDLS